MKNLPIISCFLKTDESWIDKSTLNKIGLSAHRDGPCNHSTNKLSFVCEGWSGGAMVLGKLPVPGVLQFG